MGRTCIKQRVVARESHQIEFPPRLAFMDNMLHGRFQGSLKAGVQGCRGIVDTAKTPQRTSDSRSFRLPHNLQSLVLKDRVFVNLGSYKDHIFAFVFCLLQAIVFSDCRHGGAEPHLCRSGSFYALGVQVLGFPRKKSPYHFGVCIGAPDFWKLPSANSFSEPPSSLCINLCVESH